MAALQGLTSISMTGSRSGQQGTPPPGPQQMGQMMGGRQQHNISGKVSVAGRHAGLPGRHAAIQSDKFNDGEAAARPLERVGVPTFGRPMIDL